MIAMEAASLKGIVDVILFSCMGLCVCTAKSCGGLLRVLFVELIVLSWIGDVFMSCSILF